MNICAHKTRYDFDRSCLGAIASRAASPFKLVVILVFAALACATAFGSTGSGVKATGAPGVPNLTQSDWNGSASYSIIMNMWWGNNGTTWKLYENGTLVHTQTLTDNSPNPQTASFAFSGRANGRYTYTNTLTNGFGTTSGGTLVYTVTQGSSGTIPAVPTGLTATTNSSSQITVTWNASAGATGYDLQVDGTIVASIVSPFVQTGLAANSTHSYAVRAKNSAGSSAFSALVSATTQNVPTVPATPSGLAATPNSSSQITVTWNSSAGATSYDLQVDGAIVSHVVSPYVQTGLASNSTHSYAVRADNAAGDSAFSAVVSATTNSSTTPPVATVGTINFHLLLGAGSTEDSLTLTGDNYTDLIISNYIAGVMYGHLVGEYYPGIQFDKDYLFGSIMGQLLQENLATQDYLSSSTLIDPSPDQQAVMGAGQGGPYQINNYAVDMVAGTYVPAGHSLINYIAVQKNIGYTMASAPNQYAQPTPPSFNNKYYGPLLCAYFHYNDLVALNVTGKGPGGWATPWELEYDQALANFVNLPNSFLDVILNVAYNQGYYGGLVASYSKLGATATAATVASVDSYSAIWGNTSTYAQYPYQVRYYLDQFYDNPIPTTSATTLVTPANHVAVSMSQLGNVFSKVLQTLSYSNGSNAAQFFTAGQAQAAFTAALAPAGVSGTATLDLSAAANRAAIYTVIDAALANLESAVGMKFNTTTNSQL
jgi:hypothetical protein